MKFSETDKADNDEFVPFELKLTITNLREAKFLHYIFNTDDFDTFFDDEDNDESDLIRDYLEEKTGEYLTNYYDEINDEMVDFYTEEVKEKLDEV